MNGIGLTLSRLPAARALIAGAAMLAGAATHPGRAQESSQPEVLPQGSAEDMALSVPHIGPGGLSGVALPRPLSAGEAARVRRVFALHARPDIPEALAETARLSDGLLLGALLADRYLGARNAEAGRATAGQLVEWLARYADLPDAPSIHSLLLTMLPRGAAAPPAPTPLPAIAAPGDDPEPLLKRNPMLDRSVAEPARAGRADRAVQLIARSRGLDPIYAAVLRAEVAQILFTQGRDSEALALAEAAHHQARGQIGLAPYVAGLAAWRLERPDQARPLFEAAWRAPLNSARRRAAAAFWAARAQLRTRHPDGYAVWMQRAADVPQEFYGLLARRALGRGPGAPLPEGTLGQADVDAIADTPGGRRAFGLLQVGQAARAEAELRLLWSRTRELRGFGRSIQLVARVAGLGELAGQLAMAIAPEGTAVRLPPVPLQPASGFKIDPAIIYAMARLESNFDPLAVSSHGARGLMQIMPGTAEFVTRTGGRPMHLHDPATNLDIGQRYLLQLAQYDGIGSDLIRLLASYNAGPGSFFRWSATIRHGGDPLLFIESVPNDETRAYIPRALTYVWLYAARLNLPAPSLDELAAGIWPRFTPQAPRRDVLARLH